jgi:large subunit ribosomal protein L23
MRTIWDILRAPVVTEKAMLAREETAEGRQLLMLRVDRNATKPEIKTAMETIFNVKVADVRTVNYQGKKKRRGLHEGRRPAWKKAYVTLQAGQEPFDFGEAI